MAIYGTKTVYDAALERIDYLFDEFENVIVTFSGGKDSTVVLQLALIVAERKNRLPLPVLFIDQEAEWDCVIDYTREIMQDPRVKPYWMQIPFRIFNATSQDEQWLHAWEPGKAWIRDKDPIAYHENPTNSDRFHDLFPAISNWIFKGQRYASLGGVRCEESPARRQGLTQYSCYKWITWGKVESKHKEQIVFYPIYDWTYKDVWKAIHENGWPYCKLYDYQYQYGTPVMQMRVSNVTHETAVKSLYYLQEIEGSLWSRLTQRLKGVSAAKHLQKDWERPTVLPPMFNSWEEYRDHLLETLITVPEHQATMRKHIDSDMQRYDEALWPKLVDMHISMILTNDYHDTKRSLFRETYGKYSKNANARRNARNRSFSD